MSTHLLSCSLWAENTHAGESFSNIHIGFDYRSPTGPPKDPISAPNGTEKWVSGIADSIFVFLSGRDERRPGSIYVAVKIVTRCLSHLHTILQN